MPDEKDKLNTLLQDAKRLYQKQQEALDKIVKNGEGVTEEQTDEPNQTEEPPPNE